MVFRVKKFIKQLFCFHIWKTEKTEELPNSREIQYWVTSSMAHFETYENTALYQECLKCHKKRIVKAQPTLIRG